ncbi:MAG: hypothetical protein GY705_22835 [Bacteroidetes bacterium]|nr:hypothetical protein [Bacteroidota bacterium]
MIRSLWFVFFTILTFAFLLLLPAYGDVINDLEKANISLQAFNKPVTEILKDIEKQARCTIEVRNTDALDYTKSIELDQVSLEHSLKRVLKEHNYSIIYSDQDNIITLVVLEGKKSGYNSVAALTDTDLRTANDFGSNTMDGVDSAFNNYGKNDNGEPVQASTKFKKSGTSMDGVTEAFEAYKNNSSNDKAATREIEQNETSMDEVTDVFKSYDEKDSSTPTFIEQNETSMDGLTDVFNHYNNGKE